MWLLALLPTAYSRFREAIPLGSLAPACKNTRIKISDSALYSKLLSIHIEYVELIVYGIKGGRRVVVGCAETLCARKPYVRGKYMAELMVASPWQQNLTDLRT